MRLLIAKIKAWLLVTLLRVFYSKCHKCGESSIVPGHVCGPYRVGDLVELRWPILNHRFVKIARITDTPAGRLYHVFDHYEVNNVTSRFESTYIERGLKPLKQTTIRRFYEEVTRRNTR